MITREINGCSYINSYFKFQVHPTDYKIPDENPIYIPFDVTQLQDYSEGIKQLSQVIYVRKLRKTIFYLSLRLVVLMHTNPELMQTKQPLEIFSSSQSKLRKFEIYFLSYVLLIL